jgi:hypothetical protein
MYSLPPGKYYWPGAESHEAYTDKPIIITSSTNKKIHPPTQLITGSESHSLVNQLMRKFAVVVGSNILKNILFKNSSKVKKRVNSMSIEEIDKKLDLIIAKLEGIENRLNIVEESCNGMDNHINFVNTVYTTVRTPLDFIVNRVGRLQGNNVTLALPENSTN